MRKYSVIIVTYNRLSLLRECLDCVLHQTLPFDNIIVVDNASTDGTGKYLESLKDKITVVNEEYNGGGAKGFADGLRYVHDNVNNGYVLLIDDDAMLSHDYMKRIDEFVMKNEGVRAFSGTVMANDQISIAHRKRQVSQKGNWQLAKVSEREYKKECFEYDISTFCGLVFDVSLIDVIGIPLADYFIWYDDTEYSLRIRKHSPIINVNSAYLNHKTKGGNQIQLSWKIYYEVRNQCDVIKRHGTLLNLLTFIRKKSVHAFKLYLRWKKTGLDTDKYNYLIYRDGLRDFFLRRFGFNENYHS